MSTAQKTTSAPSIIFKEIIKEWSTERLILYKDQLSHTIQYLEMAIEDHRAIVEELKIRGDEYVGYPHE